MMLPVAEERVASPMLKKTKYRENPRRPERKNQSKSSLRKGFRIWPTFPIASKITAARKQRINPNDQEEIPSPMSLVKGNEDPHKSTVINA